MRVSAMIDHTPSPFATDVLPLLQLWLVIFTSFLIIINFAGESGAEDCETTVTISNVNNSVVYVPPSGTVCFDCSGIGIIFGQGVQFIISEKVNKSSNTRTEERNGNSIVLLVTNSEKAFSTFSPETMKCCEVHEGMCFGNPHMLYIKRVSVIGSNVHKHHHF